MTYKPLFSRALGLAPERLHFAAHSHHLWPDASYEAQLKCWDEANEHADRKWELIFDEVIPEAQKQVAEELGLRSGDSVIFAPNTHDLILRIVSAVEKPCVRVLSTDGEFHSFRRQSERWEEAGTAEVTRVPLAPFETFCERLIEAAKAGDYDLILTSQVFFRTGQVFDGIEALADLAKPEGPWVVIDGYHGFMATPTDLSRVQDRVFYLAGGYKYAMAGEGACFLHSPEGFGPRPVVTGWFAEFGHLEGPLGGVQYRTDGGRFWGATFDCSALYRFNAVRQTLASNGLTTAKVAAHARGLQTRFHSAIQAGLAGPLKEAVILNPVEGELGRARFLALKSDHAAQWKAALQDQQIITDVRDDVIRFGFSLYQDEADVERLIAACSAL
jgi:selenocysteine lyase/cysteine desulfurase